jgi:coenzyme F420-reducing hydrogenase delta subunit
MGPRILVFSTDISDPGIDYAGSLHLHYSPNVDVVSVPCASGIRPAWILHALEEGFDGVFIAADGDECAYLTDCSQRAARIVAAAQDLMREAGYEPQRLKMAGICSVCAEQFGRYMHDFADSLSDLSPAGAASR